LAYKTKFHNKIAQGKDSTYRIPIKVSIAITYT
jgi:hypothetical protein